MDVNWSYYLSLPKLTLHQGVCLLHRIEPNDFLEKWQLNDNPFILRAKDKRLASHITLSEKERTKVINAIDKIKGEYLEKMKESIPPDQLLKKTDVHGRSDFDGHCILVEPLEFIIWATEKEIDIPSELVTFAQNSQSESGTAVAVKEAGRSKSKLDKQQDAILKVINDMELNPMAIPNGGKIEIRKMCENNNVLFDKTSFDRAWKKGIIKLWKMEYHEGYAKRTDKE